MDATPIGIVDAAFQDLCARPLTLDGEALGRGLPARAIPLDEMQACLLSRATSFETRDAVVAELIRRYHIDGDDWGIALAGVLLPGVRLVAARLARGFPGDTDCIDAAVLAGFFDAAASCSLDGRRLSAHLLWAAFREGHAIRIQDVVAAQYRSKQPIGVGVLRPSGHPDFVLARAVAAEVITTAEADLIGATRLDGVSLASIAKRDGVSIPTVRRRRQRAEARLIAFIRTGKTRVSRFARNRRFVGCGSVEGEAPAAGGHRLRCDQF